MSASFGHLRAKTLIPGIYKGLRQFCSDQSDISSNNSVTCKLMSAMTVPNYELTLWLWVEGMFPRRIAYFLLAKGLVTSPTDMLAKKTTDSALKIVLMKPNIPGSGQAWAFNPTEEALAPDVSSPCLRIVDPVRGQRWVRESSAILCYLEDFYSNYGPSLQPRSLVERAEMNDRMFAINEGFIHGLVYIKHAIPQTAFWSGLKNQERSHTAARNGRASMVKVFSKMQMWAKKELETKGWLTPGVDGPGLVDFNLAALCRYTELSYGWDLLDDEALRPLAKWYKRFQKLPWWAELEAREGAIPRELVFGKECREV